MDYMHTVPRLIEKFIPTNYNLSLTINRPDRIFSGIVTITGSVKTPPNSIILHCKKLDIKSITFDGKLAKFKTGANDSLIMTHQNMHKGEHIIVIDYSGIISDSMHGMYPCYFEHDGIKKELIATQFESHHAREVFPCIDEPDAKATFDVTLTTETKVTVLGNMPIKKQLKQNNLLVTTFGTTPIMSTYLLAWVIGELHKKTGFTKSGIEVNIWATYAQSEKSLDFALDIATRSSDFYEKYFDTPYPLSKCDHVALPDFGSGAMENWGLITYREVALLADPRTTSISSKHYVATVIAHELSHQWFGNLVTMKWWNDLWLNESFASLVEYLAIDAIEPDWNIWLDFASFESIAALRRDSIAGVQSVQTDVNHPDEISTLFDGAIVYAKGARLLKMLQHYIGDTAFQTGLSEYFDIYAYKNTEANDLWSILEKISNKNIAIFMDSWISKPGFPVLHVSRSKNIVTLTQEKLTNFSNKPSNELWPITLNSNYSIMPEILDVKSIDVIVNESKPLRFNIGNDAHFITHYDHDLLGKLINMVKLDKLYPIDRLQLLNEQIILANAGIISNAELILLLDAYKNEEAEAVWDIISLTIAELKKFVENDKKAEIKLREMTKSITNKQFIRLGWDKKMNESDTDTKLRSTILGLMLYSEDKFVIDRFVSLFNSTTIENLDSELRGLIISAVVRYKSNEKIIEKLLEKYKTTSSSELKQDINVGLTSTKDPKIIELLLGTIKDTSIIRTQDTARWIAYLIRNKYAKEKTWQWVRDNWDWIDATFAGDKSYDDYPRYVANALSTQKYLDEYNEFFGPLKSDPALKRVIEMGINEMTMRIKLIERDSKSVRKVLLDF
jgi:aminopeptidase N